MERHGKNKIGMGHGERCIQVASMNVDDLRTKERYADLVKRIKIQKIDVACIQETHNTEMTIYEEDGYKIIFSPEKERESINDNEHIQELNNMNKQQGINEKGTGGVSIVYNKNIENDIKQITRHSNRIMTMEIHTGVKGCNIKIICSYAPHMGYEKQIRDQYWIQIKEVLQQNNSKHCIIWGTDNNGQIQQDQSQEEWNAIGQWTYANKTENGNGEQLKKYCNKFQMSVTNTKFIPKNNNKQHLVTWQNNDEGIKKQIDFIMIDKKHSNWATQAKTKGTANPNSNYQHKLILLKIRLKMKKMYQKSNTKQTYNT